MTIQQEMMRLTYSEREADRPLCSSCWLSP